jgi:hypothetical protein
MKIANSFWGGIIPDILRNDRVTFDSVRIELTKKEFKKILKLMDKESVDLFNHAKRIIEIFDSRAELVRKMDKVATKINSYAIERGDTELLQIVSDLFLLYSEYWETADEISLFKTTIMGA